MRQLMSQRKGGESQGDNAVFFENVERFCTKINRVSNHLAKRRHNTPRFSQQMQEKMADLRKKVFVYSEL